MFWNVLEKVIANIPPDQLTMQTKLRQSITATQSVNLDLGIPIAFHVVNIYTVNLIQNHKLVDVNFRTCFSFI